MTTTTRELIRGLTGGAGFILAWLALGMPGWLAALLGVGIYAGLSLLLPPAKPSEPVSVAPGITAQERDEFVAKCAASATALQQMAGQIAEADFRARVQTLARITASLTTYCQRKPESMLTALALPRNLDHLLKMLRQYLELSQFPSPGVTVAEALHKVEDIVGNAALAFESMYEQLLDNDVAALQASATSLEYLLGTDTDLDRARGKLPSVQPPELNRPSAASPRPRQMEH